MMTEENTATEQGQEAVSIEQDTDDRDYKDLYLQEIKQHKKARARAQMAEEKNQTFADKDEKARKERLAQDGEFKTLLAEQDKELSRLQGVEKEHSTLISGMKQEILNKFSEEEQTELKDMDLKTLRLLDKKLNEQRPDNPKAKPGNVKTEKNVNLSNMTQDEKRKNWSAIIDSYKHN